MKKFVLLFLFTVSHLWGVSSTDLNQVFEGIKGVVIYPASCPEADVTVCFHGTGGDLGIAYTLRQNSVIKDHLVGFNFPDAGSLGDSGRMEKTTFGTLPELFPAFIVLKKVVVDAHAEKINLYGFSRGGGAIVNVIAILNRQQKDEALKAIGITEKDKQALLQAIQKGRVILDCPLKSTQEYADFSRHPENQFLATREKKNHLAAIDNLPDWKGLSLNVLLFFQLPDEMLPNRDDELFVNRLRAVNSHGSNRVIRADNGGHIAYHYSLWDAY